MAGNAVSDDFVSWRHTTSACAMSSQPVTRCMRSAVSALTFHVAMRTAPQPTRVGADGDVLIGGPYKYRSTTRPPSTWTVRRAGTWPTPTPEDHRMTETRTDPVAAFLAEAGDEVLDGVNGTYPPTRSCSSPASWAGTAPPPLPG